MGIRIGAVPLVVRFAFARRIDKSASLTYVLMDYNQDACQHPCWNGQTVDVPPHARVANGV